MIVFRQFSDVFQAFFGFNQVGTCLKDYFFITDSTLFQFFTEKNCLFGPFGHENPNENYFPRIFINLNFCAKNGLLTVPFLHLLGNGHFWVMPCICFRTFVQSSPFNFVFSTRENTSRICSDKQTSIAINFIFDTKDFSRGNEFSNRRKFLTCSRGASA